MGYPKISGPRQAPLGAEPNVEPLVRDRDRTFLIYSAGQIKELCKKTRENIVAIGRCLTQCQKHLDHGAWLPWLEREFGWSNQTALNFMRVYEMSKSKNFLDLDLPVSSLYLLAAPSTPDEAKAEVIERAEKGEKFSVTEIKEIINQHAAPENDVGSDSRHRRKDGRIDRKLEHFPIAISAFCGGAASPAEFEFPLPPNLPRKMVADARETIKEAHRGLRKLDARLAAYKATK
jgi:hypothetical protein